MLKVTLFALALIALASGQIHDLGQCPDVPDVNLDFDKYFGRWYEIARIDNKNEKNLRCVTFEFGPAPNATGFAEVPVTQTGYDNKNLSYTRQTTATEFWLRPYFLFLDGHSNYVVDVDYESYAAVFACDSNQPGPPFIFPSFRTRLAWILSRKPELDSGIVERLAEKLVGLGLPGWKIHYPDNKYCPLR